MKTVINSQRLSVSRTFPDHYKCFIVTILTALIYFTILARQGRLPGRRYLWSPDQWHVVSMGNQSLTEMSKLFAGGLRLINASSSLRVVVSFLALASAEKENNHIKGWASDRITRCWSYALWNEQWQEVIQCLISLQSLKVHIVLQVSSKRK